MPVLIVAFGSALLIVFALLGLVGGEYNSFNFGMFTAFNFVSIAIIILIIIAMLILAFYFLYKREPRSDNGDDE